MSNDPGSCKEYAVVPYQLVVGEVIVPDSSLWEGQ